MLASLIAIRSPTSGSASAGVVSLTRGAFFGVVFCPNPDDGDGRAGDRAALSKSSLAGKSSGFSDDNPRSHLSVVPSIECHADVDTTDLSVVANEASEVAYPRSVARRFRCALS